MLWLYEVSNFLDWAIYNIWECLSDRTPASVSRYHEACSCISWILMYMVMILLTSTQCKLFTMSLYNPCMAVETIFWRSRWSSWKWALKLYHFGSVDSLRLQIFMSLLKIVMFPRRVINLLIIISLAITCFPDIEKHLTAYNWCMITCKGCSVL